MKKLLWGLGIATGVVLLVVVGFLAGSMFNRAAPTNSDRKPDEKVLNPGDPPMSKKETPDPPPPPKPVTDLVRVKEQLKPGSTYRVGTELGFHMTGTDQDWFSSSTVTISYAAKAQISRKIVSNDGTTIVEERTFNKVQATKLESQLDDFHIELGPTGDFVLAGIGLLQPEYLFAAAGAKKLIEGTNLSGVLKAVGLDESRLADELQKDPHIRALPSMGDLEGKTVRLTYHNDLDGDVAVEAVSGGSLTAEEVQLLQSSVLLSDSLIFPNTEIKKGDTWEADSMYFVGMIDPSLMVRPEGKVQLQRAAEDVSVAASLNQNQPCVLIKVIGGELKFRESTRDARQEGYFRPTEGGMTFSPQDKIFIEAHLKGKGKLIMERNELFRTVRSDAEPEIQIVYTCKVDNAAAK